MIQLFYNLMLVLLISTCQSQSTSKPITEFSQKDWENEILQNVCTL